MNIMIVDDEWAARMDLQRVLDNVLEEANIWTAENGEDALDLCQEHKIDLAFVDIQLPDRDGLSIVRDILNIRGETNIIIQTAYPQYSLEAWKLYVSGYIVKPVEEKDVREALEHLRTPNEKSSLRRLEVRCFGQFEVFWKDRPLLFKRKRTKELFAYLVDREGAACTPEEIVAVMWESDDNIVNNKANIRNFIHDLRQTLDNINMGDILIRKRSQIAIRRDMIDCDYYRFLEGDPEAKEEFRGEYMSQYSWAEETRGRLWFREKYP